MKTLIHDIKNIIYFAKNKTMVTTVNLSDKDMQKLPCFNPPFVLFHTEAAEAFILKT